jgi:hypothetical protein
MEDQHQLLEKVLKLRYRVIRTVIEVLRELKKEDVEQSLWRG